MKQIMKLMSSWKEALVIGDSKPNHTRYKCDSYFDYSIILPDRYENEQEVLVIGNYIIRNTGMDALTQPIICIRSSSPDAVRLSGKISTFTREAIDETSTLEKWTYVNDDWKEKIEKAGEHWLMAKHRKAIQANEQISFTQFELACSKPQKQTNIIIEGFVYFKEMKEGASSLNNIILNF